MKMDRKDFEELTNDILSVVNHFGLESLRASGMGIRHIYDFVMFDRHNTDEHPAYRGRPRVVAYRGFASEHPFYQMKDAHIDTALNKINKQINLPSRSKAS